MILTQTQAEAVYSAMRALNNIAADGTARIKTVVDDLTEYIKVDWKDGDVLIGGPFVHTEWHHSQEAFAIAYGLK